MLTAQLVSSAQDPSAGNTAPACGIQDTPTTKAPSQASRMGLLRAFTGFQGACFPEAACTLPPLGRPLSSHLLKPQIRVEEIGWRTLNQHQLKNTHDDLGWASDTPRAARAVPSR